MALSRLRYLLQRFDLARQFVNRMSETGQTMSAVREAWATQYRFQPITEVMDLTGTAMCPTLNPRAEKNRDAVDHLVVRRLPFPTAWNCHVGDVVAFNSPYRFGDQQAVLVRRIAAMPGDQMLSDVVSFEPFFIPADHCWVLADQPHGEPSDVVDSRFFGPLPLENIRGRVIYSGYDRSDHGPVVNSPEATPGDAVVLKYELDFNRLYKRT